MCGGNYARGNWASLQEIMQRLQASIIKYLATDYSPTERRSTDRVPYSPLSFPSIRKSGFPIVPFTDEGLSIEGNLTPILAGNVRIPADKKLIGWHPLVQTSRSHTATWTGLHNQIINDENRGVRPLGVLYQKTLVGRV